MSLGEGKKGVSAKQTLSGVKSSEDAITRRVVRDSWNTAYAKGNVEGYKRSIGPFRAVNNLGDYLSRKDYSCGGPNQVNASKPGLHIGSIPQQCDGTGIPPSSTNVKFVSDSSDYIKYRKQRAVNSNYNDSSNGGDSNNGSYVSLMRVRRR
jgi:hypothetical protein